MNSRGLEIAESKVRRGKGMHHADDSCPNRPTTKHNSPTYSSCLTVSVNLITSSRGWGRSMRAGMGESSNLSAPPCLEVRTSTYRPQPASARRRTLGSSKYSRLGSERVLCRNVHFAPLHPLRGLGIPSTSRQMGACADLVNPELGWAARDTATPKS